jgi:hypothetical protein
VLMLRHLSGQMKNVRSRMACGGESPFWNAHCALQHRYPLLHNDLSEVIYVIFMIFLSEGVSTLVHSVETKQDLVVM